MKCQRCEKEIDVAYTVSKEYVRKCLCEECFKIIDNYFKEKLNRN